MSEFKLIAITDDQRSDILLRVRNTLIEELGAMYDEEIGDSSNPDYIGPRQLGSIVESVVDGVFVVDATVIEAPWAARPIVIENWSLGDRFTMTITPRAQPVMASYRCQINDVEVPGPVFELALRLVMGMGRSS